MKLGILILSLCCFAEKASPQKLQNSFFPLHNIIRGDSTYNTFDKQVSLIKNMGYDGIEINGEESFEGMKEALDKYGLPGSYFYIKMILDEPYLNNKLKGYIQQLKGSKTIIAPYILSNGSFPHGSHGADTLVVRIMQQLADWAEDAGLQVALYPHNSFYVERTDHALELIKAINRKNVGLTFNLCHWLATTSLAERSQLNAHLRQLSPYLKMITICGANDIVTTKSNIWDDYILPLGTGSFDTYALVKFCVKDLKLTVPIGVQCYNIKTDKYQLVLHTKRTLQQYKQKLEMAE